MVLELHSKILQQAYNILKSITHGFFLNYFKQFSKPTLFIWLEKLIMYSS